MRCADTFQSFPMIKLTRLDGEPFVLNADLIRYVERRGDTFVTLTSGDRIVVVEPMDVVIDRAVQYQQLKHYLPMPSGITPFRSNTSPSA
jgi:flagellar protein FlbD